MRATRHVLKVSVAGFGLGLALLIAPSPATAANLVVNTLSDGTPNGCTTDPNGCTLREAIIDANAAAGADTITFSVTGTIELSNDSLPLTTAMTITGPGPLASDLKVRPAAGLTKPLFSVDNPAGTEVTIARLEISGARAAAFSGGGVSAGGDGSLVLDSVRVFDNTAASGGGVHIISSPTGDGSATIRNSTFEANHADNGAGGGFGGALMVRGGFGNTPTAEVVNSTFVDNAALEFGGAIHVGDGADLAVRSSTIVNNKANSDNNASGNGGGIVHNGVTGTIAVSNTMLAGNSVGAGAPSSDGQCSGAFVSGGHNLRSAADAGCTGFTGTGDVVNANPLLGSLASNGGPTQTITLLAGSPAIDKGDPGAPGSGAPACPATDQRGLPRGGDAGPCDIGAFELQPAAEQASGSCAGHPATVDLAKGQQPTAGSDVIVGTAGNDVIVALGGNDIVCGGDGDDVIKGKAGKDRLFGEGGNDLLKGGRGDDRLSGGPDRHDVCKGGPGDDSAGSCERRTSL
jgi:CSLREA domain-containing protein